MKNISDRKKFKFTTTNKLREFIASLGDKNKTYLEIGCAHGHTITAIHDSYARVVGVDISKNNLSNAIDLFNAHAGNTVKSTFIHGTCDDLKPDHWDVIFIDDDHKYDSIKLDYKNIIEKNMANECYIIFHDYGLPRSKTKQFVHNTFNKKDIIYCGSTPSDEYLGTKYVDFEAVAIKLTLDNDI